VKGVDELGTIASKPVAAPGARRYERHEIDEDIPVAFGLELERRHGRSGAGRQRNAVTRPKGSAGALAIGPLGQVAGVDASLSDHHALIAAEPDPKGGLAVTAGIDAEEKAGASLDPKAAAAGGRIRSTGEGADGSHRPVESDRPRAAWVGSHDAFDDRAIAANPADESIDACGVVALVGRPCLERTVRQQLREEESLAFGRRGWKGVPPQGSRDGRARRVGANDDAHALGHGGGRVLRARGGHRDRTREEQGGGAPGARKRERVDEAIGRSSHLHDTVSERVRRSALEC
jgi:hypothetical protein